jgi:organic radical activating enzyme
MFGNNPKRPFFKSDGTVLEVKKIFLTLQGEGVYAGMPAIFIRLGGCNLACSFCDTDFEDYQQMQLPQILHQIQLCNRNNSGQRAAKLVVITGGEPLRQPIGPLCELLLRDGYMVQIESNGTLPGELPQESQIVCSPKIVAGKYTKINESLIPHLIAIKFLISARVPGYSSVPIDILPPGQFTIFLQPMDEYDAKFNKENQELTIQLALKHGYRLSYQLHKILEIE